MLIIWIVISSILVQLTTAFLALRLIKRTGKQLSWALIAIAMLLQASRRIFTLSGLLSGEIIASQVILSEWIGLVISILMLIGVASIGRFLSNIEKSNIERKKTAAALKAKQELLLSIFHISPLSSVLIKLPERTIAEINPAFEKMFGYTYAEIIGQPVDEIDYWADPSERNRVAEILLKEGKVNDLEFLYKTKSGATGHGVFYSEIIEQPDESYILTKVMDITGRKYAEEKLEKNSQLLQAIIEGTTDAIYLKDIDGKYLLFNHAAENFTGKKSSEVLGNDDTFLFPAEEAVAVMQGDHQVITEGKIATYEEYVTTSDGTKSTFLSTKGPILDKNGITVGLFGVTRDITEFRRGMEALHQREYLLSASQQAAHIGTWSWKVGDSKVFWSDETYRIYGLNPAMGTPDFEFFFEIIHPEDRHKMQEWPKAVIAGLHPPPVEFRVLRSDGIYRTIQTEGDVIESVDGIPSRIAGTAYDITERKQSEAALIETQFKLNEAYKLAHMGIWEWESETDTVIWTEELYHISGLDPLLPAPTYKEHTNLYAPKSWKLLNNLVERALKTGEPYQAELELIRPDGEIRYVKAFGGAKLDTKGQIIGLFGTLQDITEQRLAEEALKKSRQLLAETESIGKVGGWEINIDTMDTIWTDEVYAIHEVELNSNQNVEKGINFYVPESKPVIEKAVQRAIELSEPFDVELEIISAKGNLKKVHAIGKPDLENHRVYGFFQDITERKQMEESLRKNEARLSNIFEQANDGIYIINSDNQYIDINRKGLELLGYTKDELLQLNVADVLHPDEVARLAIEPPKMMSGMPHLAEWIHIRKDGSSFPGEVSARRLNDYSYLAIIRDLTERKKSEAEIKLLNERIGLATNAGGIGIFDYDVINNILIWDEQMFRLYGISPDEFGNTYEASHTRIHPDDIERGKKDVELALKGEKEFDSEFRCIWPDGSIHIIHAFAIVKRDNAGNPTRMIGTNYDITKRKQAEENIRILNDELEQRVLERTAQLEAANNELEAFSYSVSHDLRAPLRHINGYVDLLNTRFRENLPEKARHYLATVTDASKQMGKLIDDLLQFSRSGRQEVHKEKLDMNGLVSEVLEKITPGTENRKITWSVQQMPEVSGDYSLLKQVWINLLDNAVKYTKYKKSTEISIEFREEKEKFVFFIRDNGVGFDMKYANKLFGVFQRLHTQTEFEGTGIGLANVQRIILKHSGQVWAKAEPDKGATFFFTLPKN